MQVVQLNFLRSEKYVKIILYGSSLSKVGNPVEMIQIQFGKG